MVDTGKMTDTARDLGGKVQDAIGDVAAPYRAPVEDRLREAQGTAKDLYGQARDAVRHAADEVSDHAADAYDRSRDLAWEGHQKSVEWPHASLVVAGLVGFGLGLLVSKL